MHIAASVHAVAVVVRGPCELLQHLLRELIVHGIRSTTPGSTPRLPHCAAALPRPQLPFPLCGLVRVGIELLRQIGQRLLAFDCGFGPEMLAPADISSSAPAVVDAYSGTLEEIAYRDQSASRPPEIAKLCSGLEIA